MIPTPNSELYLLSNVELDPDYNFTIDFDNKQAQHQYFNGKISNKLEINEDYSFIRADESVKVQASVEDLDGVNYVMYKNDTRWHYAFVLKKEYVSHSVTRLVLKYDVYQTFMFDFTLDESFIDREHQDRFFGSLANPQFNTQPENVNVGTDYQQSTIQTMKQFEHSECDLYWVLVSATQEITGDKPYSSSDRTTWVNSTGNSLFQNGNDTGLYTYLFPVNRKNRNTKFVTPHYNGNDVELYNGVLWASKGSEAVLSVRVLPYCPVPFTCSKIDTNKYRIVFENGYKPNVLQQNENYHVMILTPNKSNWGGVSLSNMGGYTLCLHTIDENTETKEIGKLRRHSFINLPEISKDNTRNFAYETKLFTYPYFYFSVGDFRSEPILIKNENFGSSTNATLTFNIRQALGVQQKARIFPTGYLGDEEGKENCSINAGIDELPLRTNSYIQYLSQSKASATTGVALNIASGIAQAGLGLASGGFGATYGISQALGIGQQIANEMIKREDLKGTPDTIRKQGNNIEFDLLDNNLYVVVREKKILSRYIYQLANYFFHYGYKANEFKKPDTRSRFYFNYIRTIGANIKTNIDAEYKSQLANIFDNGVTIWHYRGSDSFKGVNNFEYENAEMALI